MNKTLCCIIIVVGSYFVPENQIKAFSPVSNESCTAKSSSRVTLRGSLPTPTTRSIFQPVEVFLNAKELNIYYLYDLGNVEVSIINKEGSLVFNETQSITKGDQSLIDLNDFPEGIYEIKFRNSDGDGLSGSFNV